MVRCDGLEEHTESFPLYDNQLDLHSIYPPSSCLCVVRRQHLYTHITECSTHIRGTTWLGANDLTTEGSWIWSDGVTSEYTNWFNGAPSNTYSYLDCGYITTSGSWGSTYTGYRRMYVCEKPLDKGECGFKKNHLVLTSLL